MNTNPSNGLPTTRSRGWRIARRLLLGTAALATLLALFYTVENWRGKRGWENCRRELEAKGEVLDWAAYIPEPVPDDQNFYKAPKMQEWFVRPSWQSFVNTLKANPRTGPEPFALPPRTNTVLVVAEVTVSAAGSTAEPASGATVLSLENPAARQEVARLLGEAIGPSAIGAQDCVLLKNPVEQIKPLRLRLQASGTPGLKELRAFFFTNTAANDAFPWAGARYLSLEPVGSNSFRLQMETKAYGGVYGAAEYLARTDSLKPQFELLATALQRPFARMDGDYRLPFAMPVPDFVRVRQVAQILAQRAQCYLLLDQPEAALGELDLLDGLGAVLTEKVPAKSSHKGLTLVAAMIDVALSGLHSSIVAEGMRLHAWREPQLATLEQQLRETDLLKTVLQAWRTERAAASRTFEMTSRRQLVDLLKLGFSAREGRYRSGDVLWGLALTCMPRGWYYQNMTLEAQLEQECLGCVDMTNRVVHPREASESLERTYRKLQPRSPYNVLAAVAVPNFAKAVETAARNQTLADQALVACALEKYRAAEGRYPERLEEVARQSGEKLPHDLIDGAPLKYRLTPDGSYLLYSVGWNEKDDGGVTGKNREEGDWVWEAR